MPTLSFSSSKIRMEGTSDYVERDMAERQLEELPSLQSLPFDIKDHILSFIESPRHLLSFGLASKEWASLIIPNHIEYRELRVLSARHDVWKHLAARADLAKTIHTVCLIPPKDESKEIFPRTLAGTVFTQLTRPQRQPRPEMLQAIRNFKSLRNFTWVAGRCEASEYIFEALGHCNELDKLYLSPTTPLRDRDLNPGASLWKLRNLTNLVLRGLIWGRLESIEDSFMSLLNNSPNLENLTMSYDTAQSKFTSCTLSNLRKLHLWTVRAGGDSAIADAMILDFLFAHPKLEDLRWHPLDTSLILPLGLLPNLKRIDTDPSFATGLLRDKTLFRERKMECISTISLSSNTIQLLGMIDGSCLDEIHLWRFDGLDAIKRLAFLFPSIRILLIPNFGYPSAEETYTLDDYIDCLACFLNLEAVLSSFLWSAIQLLKNQEQLDTITKLLTRCSKLKRLDYRNSFDVDRGIIFDRCTVGATWKEVARQDDWALV